MSKTYNVAVVGATGAVGETMLKILAERHFPIGSCTCWRASARPARRSNSARRKLVVQDLATFDPKGVDIALFSAGG